MDNDDQDLVILPFSIKTVKGQEIFFCLLPHTLSNAILLFKISKPHSTNTYSTSCKLYQKLQQQKKEMTPSYCSHQLPSPEHKELHPRILPADYLGKGGKIFCSTVPHIRGAKTPTRCSRICTKIKKSVKPCGFPPPRYV